MLSEDETYILVAESATNKIHRYYLKGPKKGTNDVFVDGLPGIPDNINTDGKGGYLVSLVIGVDSSHPALFQIIRPFPLVRKLIARIFGLTELAFRVINQIYPNELAERGLHMVSSTFTLLFAFSSVYFSFCTILICFCLFRLVISRLRTFCSRQDVLRLLDYRKMAKYWQVFTRNWAN